MLTYVYRLVKAIFDLVQLQGRSCEWQEVAAEGGRRRPAGDLLAQYKSRLPEAVEIECDGVI
jgi:hypothetical protein